MDTTTALDNIHRYEHLNAFISTTDEADTGTVVAIKDNIDVRGVVTTAATKMRPDVPAFSDADLVSRIREHGCLIVGKTNLEEWALGPTGINPHYGTARNPYDEERIAGGSSSGSAVAVAKRMCDWAVGTDTGGSVRMPSALCGVVGFKPTYGSISLRGVIPTSPSADTAGSLAPDVRMATEAIGMMGGPRITLPSTPPQLSDYRLAVPRGWVYDLHPEVGQVWGDFSYRILETPFPSLSALQSLFRTIAPAEITAYHAERLKTQRDGFSSGVLPFVESGTSVSAVGYLNAKEQVVFMRESVEESMKEVDAVVLPTTATTATPIDSPEDVREPMTRYTRPFALTGHPAITVPAPSTGLPVGIQVVGHVNEDRLTALIALALQNEWT